MTTPQAMDPVEVRQLGTVVQVRRGVVVLDGLSSCVAGQLIQLGPRARGLVIGFRDHEALALLLDARADLVVGQRVETSQEPWRLGVGEALLGRIVSPLGEPLDGAPAPAASSMGAVFRQAPGILQRMPVSRQLMTGLMSIDTMIPVGRGQRELILGDRMTGKTTLALDAMLSQRAEDVVSVYCLIGHSHQKLRQLLAFLEQHQARERTVIVAATASDSASLQFLAPYAACAVGEYFMDRRRDVLVVFDDLSKHAWAWRQVSLLMDRPPGREAYPGDMFYVHAQIMERAGQLSAALGGGSMTFLPICETQQGDVTGYIPSNLIAMTDGQLYLSGDLFYEGMRPAIDLGLSVSRIGNKVQSPALRQVSGQLRLEALQHRELRRLSQVGSRTTPELAGRLRRGRALQRLLRQGLHHLMSPEEQLARCYAFGQGWLERLNEDGLLLCERGLSAALPPPAQEALRVQTELTAPLRAQLDQALQAVLGRYLEEEPSRDAIVETR